MYKYVKHIRARMDTNNNNYPFIMNRISWNTCKDKTLSHLKNIVIIRLKRAVIYLIRRVFIFYENSILYDSRVYFKNTVSYCQIIFNLHNKFFFFRKIPDYVAQGSVWAYYTGVLVRMDGKSMGIPIKYLCIPLDVYNLETYQS